MTAFISSINVYSRAPDQRGARSHDGIWVVEDNQDEGVKLSGRLENPTLRGAFTAAENAALAGCEKLNRMTAAERAYSAAQEQAAAQEEQ